MTERRQPRVLSIPAGVAFLDTVADALMDGRLIERFRYDGDPLQLAEATIYVPTRRAARALRASFVERLGRRSAILPTIRPLGEFEDDAAVLEDPTAQTLALATPIEAMERILLLAPLVQAWKRRLPAHLAALFGEEVVVPASLADAIWLSRDLAALMDEVETGGADWQRLASLAPEDLANWWQVTLEFLEIVTRSWPALLVERDRSNPAAYRNATIIAEATRLQRNPPTGPVIAAGSTGSIPATATLLKAIGGLPLGAVVLPGLDLTLDQASWDGIAGPESPPSTFGHPQAGMKRLLSELGVGRADVVEIARPDEAMAARLRLLNEALRPAETTDRWAELPLRTSDSAALSGLTLVEAANEREEALAIALALRLAVGEGRSTALVTGDRNLARRVAAELRRFGIEADDSGGSPLSSSPPAALLRLMLEATMRPGDPVAVLALLKHPLMHAGMDRTRARLAAETVDLIALRGGTGRPDLTELGGLFGERLAKIDAEARKPFWRARLDAARLDDARALIEGVIEAIAPLAALRTMAASMTALARVTVEGFEALGRDETGSVAALYQGDAGDALASFLRSVLGAAGDLPVEGSEWPDVFAALIAGAAVKPSVAGDPRVAIWGPLEARLQHVDTLVLGGLNEGSWPRKAEPDRFMSRYMKIAMNLDPPERRIGQSAHDFVMAMGAPRVVLTRAARADDAPALESRWLQRLRAVAGTQALVPVLDRGRDLIHWTAMLDHAEPVGFAARPKPTPSLALRPRRLSVTEIETLRRDPYAIYARHVLKLRPLEPLLRDPGAAERGSLFHDIVHAFALCGVDPDADEAEAKLLEIGRAKFDEAGLPPDIDAVWWPRFVAMASGFIGWERERPAGIRKRLAEARAAAIEVGATGVSLSGYADRIDLRAAGMADILDFKTGTSPSKAQAHTLLAPQLALEGALLMRGAFLEAGKLTPAELAHVRMKPNGDVIEESILEYKRQPRSAPDLSDEAWSRLEALLAHYADETNGYISRALPFREGDTTGDYDHLARVLEWSAGGDGGSGDGDGE
jgi:ATP-dependent helicase/nuclease subunit B